LQPVSLHRRSSVRATTARHQAMQGHERMAAVQDAGRSPCSHQGRTSSHTTGHARKRGVATRPVSNHYPRCSSGRGFSIRGVYECGPHSYMRCSRAQRANVSRTRMAIGFASHEPENTIWRPLLHLAYSYALLPPLCRESSERSKGRAACLARQRSHMISFSVRCGHGKRRI